GGKLVLTLHTQPTAARISGPKTTVEAPAAAASKTMSPFAPRVADVTAVAKPAVTAPAVSDAAPAKTVAANAAPAASGFVVVEPTYAAKAAASIPTDEPADRAQE